jgi:septum site-determining protein MinD
LEGKANLTEILNPSYNFFFISPSLNLQDLTNFSIENLEKLKYSLNNQYFDFVLIDSSPGFGKEALLSFSFADEILIVSNPTYLSLIDSIKCKQLAENLGKKVIGVILNRYSSQALREEDFERLLNLDVLGKVSESKFGKNIEVYGNQLYFVDKKFKEEIDRIAAKIAGIELKENLSSQFLNFFRNFWRR